MMNGTEVGRLSVKTPNTEETILVPVPEEMQNADVITVTVSTAQDKMSPMIYEVRLVKE